MRVVHVLSTGGYSGAESVVIRIIKNMKNVDSVYVSPKGIITDILNDNDISYYCIDRLNRSELSRMVDALKPDIIHAHDFTAGFFSVLMNRHIPIINHLHHNAPWQRKINLRSALYFFIVNNIDRILVVSESIINDSIFGSKIKGKVDVVGNPIDTKEIIEKSEKADTLFETDVLFCGRLAEAKNPIAFIEIICRLKKKYPDIKAGIVGDGELRDEVVSKIDQYHLENNVLMFGFLDNPYGMLRKSKVVCMPSKWEGYGMAAVEALTLGTPVVASPVGGLPGIIDNSCGALCSDYNEFVNEISSLISDENKHKEQSKAAIKKSKEFDNINEYSNHLKVVYEDLL